MKTFFSLLLALPVFFAPMLTFAACTLPCWGPLVSCTGYVGPAPIANPPSLPSCVSLCDVFATAQNVLNFGITLVLFVFVPIYAALGAFSIIIAAGSPERMKQGRRMIFGAVVGAVIALSAFVILNTFFWLLGAVLGAGGVPWPSIACTA